jgi:hypothetical protein
MIVEELGGAVQFDIDPVTLGVRSRHNAAIVEMGVDGDETNEDETARFNIAWCVARTRNVIVDAGDSLALRTFEDFWSYRTEHGIPDSVEYFIDRVPVDFYPLWLRAVRAANNQMAFPVSVVEKAPELLTDEERADPN